MRERGRPQQLRLARRQGDVVAGGSDPDRRHAADGRAESDQRRLTGLGQAVRRAVDRDAHGLADLLAGLRRMREAGSERCGIGLERGVAPVALILDLEQGPFELEGDPHTIGHLDIQAVEGREQCRGQAPDEVLRPDIGRKRALVHALRCARAEAATGVLGRVQDAPADAVELHRGIRDPIEAEREAAVLSSRELAVPGEIHAQGGIGAVRVEAQREAALAGIEADAAEVRCDRSPVAVAHRCVQAAHDLDLAEAHVADIRAFQLGDERACAHRAPLGWRLITSVPPLIACQLWH